MSRADAARPTEEEFAELKRRRDAAIEAAIAETCAKLGWPRDQVHAHACHAGDCYCACPDGPCQHVWDGPPHEEDGMWSLTCSRCGTVAAYHDLRVAT